MPEKVFLRGPDNIITPLQSQPFSSESELDETIEQAPHLLSAALSTEDRELKFLFVEKQASIDDEQGDRTGRWSADLLFLDNEGIVTIVEDKLSRNPEIRRKVVGQAIEYAANIFGAWTIERVRNALDSQYDDANESVMSAFDLNESEVEDYWARVGNGLRAGAIRLVFAADALPRELKLSIEFLNQVTNPLEVVGIEIKQLHDGREGGMNVLVASGVGLSERNIKQRSGSSSPPRTEAPVDEFMQVLRQFAPMCEHGPIALQVAKRLLENDDLLRTDIYKTGKGTQLRCRFHRRTDDLCLLGIGAHIQRQRCSVNIPARRAKWPSSVRDSFSTTLGLVIGEGLGGLDDWLVVDAARADKLVNWVLREATRTDSPGTAV